MSSEKANRGGAIFSKSRVLSCAALLAIASAGAGCHQQGDKAQVDITVQIDPALQLDQVVIDFKGPTSKLSKTAQVAVAGTPPSYPDVGWPISILDVSSPFAA